MIDVLEKLEIPTAVLARWSGLSVSALQHARPGIKTHRPLSDRAKKELAAALREHKTQVQAAIKALES